MSQQIVSLVVAMNNKRIIGVDNTLPWHIPEDLNHFRQLTLGKPVIMGSKTYASIGKPLPKRTNVVITRNSNFADAGIVYCSSLEDALNQFRFVPEVCIIGGGQIFALSLNYVNVLHFTIVDVEVSTTNAVFFPPIDLTAWQIVNESDITSKSGIKCKFISYAKQMG
jgi:dihydrofolate reductase